MTNISPATVVAGMLVVAVSVGTLAAVIAYDKGRGRGAELAAIEACRMAGDAPVRTVEQFGLEYIVCVSGEEHLTGL